MTLSTITESWLFRPSTRRDRICLTLPFYLLFLVLLCHHAVWRDEINAWAISYVSTSIPNLLYRVHYEAHPALWYLILYLPAQFTHAVWGLKLAESLIATGIYFVLAWFAPFRRLELLLVLAGFYLTFEYTVLARMYGMAVVGVFAYAVCRTRHPDRVLRNSLWLAFIANVDVTTAILAFALWLEYALTRLTTPLTTRSQKARELLGTFAIYFSAFSIAVITLWPAKDIGWSSTGKIFSHFYESGHLVQSAIKWITIPWLPKAINVDQSWDYTDWPYFFAAPVLLFVFYLVFRSHWRQGVAFVALLLLSILFTHITSVAGVRHTGFAYVGFLVMLWIWRADNEHVSPIVYALLFMVAVPGIIAVLDQFSWTYTSAETAAAWMQQQHLQDMPLFGSEDTDMVGIPERLQRPYYQLNGQRLDTVLTFTRARDSYKESTDLVPRLATGFAKLQVHEGILISTARLTRPQEQQLSSLGLHDQLIGDFEGGFLSDESTWIYRVTDAVRP